MSANSTPTRIGAINLGADSEALFLKMYSGKVLDTFQTACKMENMVDVQTIGAGKSFQFPVVGRAEAKYHQRGKNILDPANGFLNEIELDEKIIYLDRPLVSARTTDDWDQLVNHWEAASRLATEQGQALARKRDQQLLQLVWLASQEPATLLNQPSDTNVAPGGNVSVGVGGIDFSSKANAEAVVQAIGTAAATLAERNVPMEEIWVACTPAQYYGMLTAPDSPFIRQEVMKGANGDLSMGHAISRVAGFNIFSTNHMPSGVVGEDIGTNNDYGGTFPTSLMLAFHKSCIGSVRRQGMTVTRSRQDQIMGDLIQAYFIEGHGILRPEASVAIIN
jgi:hypothetical protein